MIEITSTQDLLLTARPWDFSLCTNCDWWLRRSSAITRIICSAWSRKPTETRGVESVWIVREKLTHLRRISSTLVIWKVESFINIHPESSKFSSNRRPELNKVGEATQWIQSHLWIVWSIAGGHWENWTCSQTLSSLQWLFERRRKWGENRGNCAPIWVLQFAVVF